MIILQTINDGDPPTNPVPTTETRDNKGEKGEKR